MYMFCDYDTSVMLKEMGFNETCEYCFDTSRPNAIERQTPTNVFGSAKHNSSDPYLVACPMLVEAIEWIFVHHGIEINSDRLQMYNDTSGIPLYMFKCSGLPVTTDGVVYHDENNCRNKAIQYTLKVLSHDRN